MSHDIAEAPPVEAVRNPTEAAPFTILLVDDESSVLHALRRVFRPMGCKVLLAGSGAEGLTLLEANPVDLVISDMRMPEMDGARFLELARDRRPDVVRILLTGYADIGSTIAAINRGEIHRYITKPWDDQDLMLVVRETLARRELERRNAELSELTRLQNRQLTELNRQLESRVAARTAELEQVNSMLGMAYEDLDRTFMTAVNVFSALLETREGSAGHARRVAALSRETAVKLGLTERDARDVYLGGLLHDVGKIGFPDRMMGRPVSAFSAEERARYNRHPVDGETALMPLPQLQAAAQIVRQHHERLDGRGFPDGLSGSDICMGARIVSVASDYDGLLNGTLSQAKYVHDRAAQLLRASAGTHYDAKVVEALIAVVEEQEAAANAGHLIDVRELRAGMVLARDLVSPKGAILLAAGYVFDDRIVRQVCEFADREQIRLGLYVRSD
ncbi:HD domain-containing phosphohydrolase [Ideonella sp. DXS29W]|uniref:HD domain-containing phosphohydrolase n=1 Tax=Ideonella lacteola TaxID=2984193 RepID=A0ABU9BVQ3_9BURK